MNNNLNTARFIQAVPEAEYEKWLNKSSVSTVDKFTQLKESIETRASDYKPYSPEILYEKIDLAFKYIEHILKILERQKDNTNE